MKVGPSASQGPVVDPETVREGGKTEPLEGTSGGADSVPDPPVDRPDDLSLKDRSGPPTSLLVRTPEGGPP